jgi:histidyl-tRNA synthetase
MVAQRQKQLIYPLRWWSFGPFWRYERPQKGRTREFFQWNIDLIGVNTPEADAEMIAIVATFFKEVGLPSNKVKILINDRILIENELKKLEITSDHYQNTFRLIDRKDKLSSDKWKDFAREMGLKEDQIIGLSEMLVNDQLWRKSISLNRIFSALESLGVREYVRYDPNIIRGLDYYTSTVFEAKEWEGEIHRSILGGGRYDNLLADVGGEPLPAVGFAMGDVVMTLILKSKNCIPEQITQSPAEIIVTIFEQGYQNESLAFASELRQAKLNTICYPEATNLGKQFKYASKIQAKFAVIIGPDEIEHNAVSIKDLRTGSQQNIPRLKAVTVIRNLLDNV